MFFEKTNDNENRIDLIGQELKKADELSIKVKQRALAGKPYQRVLAELLSHIQPVDFRERAEVNKDQKIPLKNYSVIAVDETIKTAIANKWGLANKHECIYVYNGKYWQLIEANDFKFFLGEVAIKMGVPELEAKHHLFTEEIYKQILSRSYLTTPEPDKTVRINLLNGTFEITDEKQELREPRPEDFMKYQLPFEYDPDAQCPLFMKYLNRVLPDVDCQKVLSEYLGYIFIPNLKLEKALLLHGSGSNGKSVLFEIVTAILGEENICSYSLQSLTSPSSYQRAELSNKLLNYASEINGIRDGAIFKQLVSGEPVEARHIYGKPFTMREYGRLMFNCNALPSEVEQTHAYFRRIAPLPFNQTIPESEQDPELAKKIIATELSGIWNWILAGLHRVLENKRFTDAELVRNQVEDYRKSSDSVAMFIEDEGYKPTNGSPNALLKFMYGDYKPFCIDNGYRACSLKTFAERLRTLTFQTEKTRDGILVYAAK